MFTDQTRAAIHGEIRGGDLPLPPAPHIPPATTRLPWWESAVAPIVGGPPRNAAISTLAGTPRCCATSRLPWWERAVARIVGVPPVNAAISTLARTPRCCAPSP